MHTILANLKQEAQFLGLDLIISTIPGLPVVNYTIMQEGKRLATCQGYAQCSAYLEDFFRQQMLVETCTNRN
jgi:hypothetical protein